MIRTIVTRLSLVAASALLVAACGKQLPEPRQNTVETVFQAGKTNVAVLGVQRWDEAKKKLSANFQLDGAGALQLALPRTSAMEERLLDALGVELGLGLPTIGTTRTRTTDLADDQTTGTREETREPGEAPDVDDPAAVAGGRTLDDQPRLTDEQRNAVLAANDPILHYQAANAIYQFVQMINGLVESTPQVDLYEPYLVTLQISSVPYARHQPYDVHLDVSFYPKVDRPAVSDYPCGFEALPPHSPPPNKQPWSKYPFESLSFEKVDDFYKTPIVVPVLVTDNLEGQVASRSAELIRQIGLAATAVQSGIAANFGLSSFNARAGAVFGTDLTSTFTVGKTAENSLTAVLGAPRNPVSDYAMTRRTHNVSVLLLVPKDTWEADDQWLKRYATIEGLTGKDKDPNPEQLRVLRRIQVIFSAALRRPDKVGPPLPLGRELALKELKKSVADRGLLDAFRGRARHPYTSTKLSNAQILESLSKYLSTGDYPGFLHCVIAICPDYPAPSALFHTMSSVYGANPLFRSTAIPLPPRKRPAPFVVEPLKDGATALDDPNRGLMTVTIASVSGTTPPDLTATLILERNDGGMVPFVANGVQREKSRLTFTFPSAAAFGLTDIKPSGGRFLLYFAKTPGEPVVVAYQAAPKTKEGKDKDKDGKQARAVVTATPGGGLEVELTEAKAPTSTPKPKPAP